MFALLEIEKFAFQGVRNYGPASSGSGSGVTCRPAGLDRVSGATAGRPATGNACDDRDSAVGFRPLRLGNGQATVARMSHHQGAVPGSITTYVEAVEFGLQLFATRSDWGIFQLAAQLGHPGVEVALCNSATVDWAVLLHFLSDVGKQAQDNQVIADLVDARPVGIRGEGIEGLEGKDGVLLQLGISLPILPQLGRYGLDIESCVCRGEGPETRLMYSPRMNES